MRQAPPGYQQIAAARTMEVLAVVRSRAMAYHRINHNAERKVQQARQHLAKHFREEIDMRALARELGISYSRFRSRFKECTGVPPHQYQTEIRLNLARHWLTDSDLSVSEIAEQLGFSSVYYFSRLFKKKVGCPPGAFRKR